MKIEIKDDSQTLIVSNEELDNLNFIDLELCDSSIKDEDNKRGHVSECTMPIEELKCAVDAFWKIRMNNKE